MTKHFDTLAAATESLKQFRFTEIRPGLWVNMPDRVRATLHPTVGSEVIAVSYSHIEI